MQEHWEKIRQIHFDSNSGAPFWLQRAREMKIDVFKEVNTIDDFQKLGRLTLETLRETPPESFIPKSRIDNMKIPIESGGSSGEPVLTFFSPMEFEQAFVFPFLDVVAKNLFPKDGNWLYLGPTGPHAIGRAANICAKILTKQEPYSIDFDPRWAKKLPFDSLPAKRYLHHLCEQAILVWKRVPISILFATPPILDQLCEMITDEQREKITGIQLGGMNVTAQQWARWKKCFPNAKFLIGYGNSLVGVMYHIDEFRGYVLPESKRIAISIESKSKNEMQPGRIIVHRLDHTILYLNLHERDQALQKTTNGRNVIYNVEPLATMLNVKKGLY